MRRRVLLENIAFAQGREAQEGVNTSAGAFKNEELISMGSQTIVISFMAADMGSPNQMLFSGYPIIDYPRAYLQGTSLVISAGGNYIEMKINVNIRYHIALVVDVVANTASGYVNGSLLKELIIKYPILPGALGYYVGSWGPALNFRGVIYSNHVFNYALSAAEVATLWNGGDPAGYALPTSAKQTSCIAEYLPQNLVPAVVDHEPVNITKNASYTWMGATDQMYANEVRFSRSLRPGCAYRLTFTVSDFEAGAPFLVANRGVNSYIPASNGTHVVDVYIVKAYDKLLYTYGGNQNADRRLTLTLDSIESLDNIGKSWLDSAKQLPLNDEYLPPLRGSIGGHDLTASGSPKIAHKPTLTKVIRADLMATSGVFLNYWFSADKQPDATWRRLDGKIHINCGVTPVFNMPGVTLANCSFRVGKRYRVLCKWTLLKGDVRLTAFGNWANGKYTAIDSTFHTELKQYSWDSGILPYSIAQTPYNSLYLYFGNSLPDSEYTIDELILEEYD